MEIIPDKRRLVGLVENAYLGKACLPNFQRDFVWKRDQVRDLIVSVLRRYYIGSLLLLRCDPQAPPFAPQAVRGARPPLTTLHPEVLILDGQQRLTSMLYALAAPDATLKDSSQRRWFFVNVRLLAEDVDDPEIVFDRSKRDLNGLLQPAAQYAQGILPCTALMNPTKFMEWRDGYDDWVRENDPSGEAAHRARRNIWSKVISDFQNFEVPLVELPRVDEADSEALGRVCAIFEKLNSTGVDLSVYDLLNARLYRSGIELRKLWEEACATHPRLAAWSKGKPDTEKFGVQTLRTLALLRGLDPKPRVLINLAPQQFQTDWRRAATAIDTSAGAADARR